MPAQINFECPDLLQSEVLEPIQNHIDVGFVKQYVEVLFKKDGFGLKELQRSILEHDWSRMVRQTIISFYVGILAKVIHSLSEPSEFLKGSEALQIFQQFILPLVDSNTHSQTVDQPTFTLKMLFYELLLEMYKKQISENDWPFKLDISNMIVYPLANESTPISLRKIIEQSAILRINSSEKALEYGNNELIDQLAHVLRVADFNLVYMSCTRILSCKNSVNILLSSGHGIPIILKAKKLKKIENSFAQLVADLMFNKVLDLLAIVSDYDLNFVGPLLNEYKLFKTNEQLLNSPKWRYVLNKDAILSFVHSLLDVCDIESIIKLFEQYILPYLLVYFISFKNTIIK
ncbi:unnamed protein product [Meloidogyne enterolobii]|uniref:Uncharacterized protein n=1 Tax=Meloidogyne enterolobii TaxID=390850 RepID=A0ACB0YJA0_MELEN